MLVAIFINEKLIIQWDIFIILIVSCANVIVAPGNLGIIATINKFGGLQQSFKISEIAYVHHKIQH